MIGRLWHGWTARENANAYEELLRSRILPGIHRIEGYRGAHLLRRDVPEGVEFATLTFFESMEAVRAFAGEDYETAVVPAEARRLLAKFDQRSRHYEIVASEAESGAAGSLRSILWTRLDRPGLELARLRDDAGARELAGTVLLLLEETPWEIRYEILLDPQWRTRRASVLCRAGGEERRLDLRTEGTGRWWSGERELDSVAGCLDVDLSFTPATNTLPIRRLRLPVGGVAPVRAAWVLFPGLEVRPLEQTYRREAEDRYRYQSATGFEASIEVDEAGLVTDYPGLWKALAGRET